MVVTREPDDADDDGGHVGIGGDADVLEDVHGVEYDGEMARGLLEEERSHQDE